MVDEDELVRIIMQLRKENEELRYSLNLSRSENQMLMKVNDRCEKHARDHLLELEEMRKRMLRDRHEAD